MDGTLLDKYFDDYFWEHLLPEKFAEKKKISFGKAKEELLARYKIHEGTLNWTDTDFWSREVDIDIPALKEQMRHLIEVHPHVVEFLQMLRQQKKKIFLVTNAHYKVLEIKLKKTELSKYFGGHFGRQNLFTGTCATTASSGALTCRWQTPRFLTPTAAASGDT